MQVYVNNEYKLTEALNAIKAAEKPFTVSITEGKKRSLEQNALQWKWCQDVSKQLGDLTPDEVQAYNKLHHGVPIMREIDWFLEKYDKFIKPHPYEDKLKLMEGDMFPVTRLMTTEQKTRFLEAVCKEWLGRGISLTLPHDMGLDLSRQNGV